jgi:hypothetical protein
VIFARVGAEMGEAFTMLRAYSSNYNMRLTAAAQAIINPSTPAGLTSNTTRPDSPLGTAPP